MSFVVYHECRDHRKAVVIIYVGNDKTEAFDALINFIDNDESQSNAGIWIEKHPTPYTDATHHHPKGD